MLAKSPVLGAKDLLSPQPDGGSIAGAKKHGGKRTSIVADPRGAEYSRGDLAPPIRTMIVNTSVFTGWIIEVPTGDAEFPWISLGSMFPTEQKAKADLRSWRPELQDVARVRQHTYESFTAHEA